MLLSHRLQKLSTSVSLVAFVLTFVTGLLIGYGLSSYSHLNSAMNCTPQSTILQSCSPLRPVTVQEEISTSTLTAEEPEATSRSENNGNQQQGPCLPFMYDLKLSFLSRLANSSSANSIIQGGHRLFLSSSSSSTASNQRSFRQIGNEMKDDKTLLHRFDNGYETYLGHPLVRGNSDKLSIFEVGLGCNQHMGVGASVKLWGEFLPNARLAMLEFDEKCAKEWPLKEENKKTAPKGGFVVYSGDQSSPATWAKVLAAEDQDVGGHSRMYDVVIDDGGHTMNQQITTFMHLWPRVKPGGVYVIEDMNTSWKTRYQGTKRMTATSKTTNNLVKILMDRVHSLPLSEKHPRKADEDLKRKSPIHRVDCMHFICFISKRWEE